MTTLFQIGEVVFGKIKGYPWWPSMVIDYTTNLIYTIKFYNDNSYAKLSSKYLLKYKENKKKILEANKKNKKLIVAIKEADLELKKSENMNSIINEQYNNNDSTAFENTKSNINNENIQLKSINLNDNFEPKKIEKIFNHNINNNLINISEIMSEQNNKSNIFSITKNNKNIITINNSNSISSDSHIQEESHNSYENKGVNIDTLNNNHLIIDKTALNLENDDELSSLLQSSKFLEKKIESEKSLKKIKVKVKKDEINDKEKEKDKKQEKYFIRIEIENLEAKGQKKKETKFKAKIDDKAKEEKRKREEEDSFLYEIDEYFYKILEFFNNKNYERLDYEKEQFKRVLIYLANFKRNNFIEFLKMTNISKYIQYFVCYLKDYDKELNLLAKTVYRNFHKQFNKQYFGEKMAKFK